MGEYCECDPMTWRLCGYCEDRQAAENNSRSRPALTESSVNTTETGDRA